MGGKVAVPTSVRQTSDSYGPPTLRSNPGFHLSFFSGDREEGLPRDGERLRAEVPRGDFVSAVPWG